MKNHVWRPLFLAIICVALLLIVRSLYVPDDFGVHGQNFTYGYHRLSNIEEWKDFKIKYRGKEYCRECHEDNVEANLSSHHSLLECENCHDPAVDHPEDPEVLPIESSRLLCLRCHAFLPYPQSNRADMPAVDPDNHNPGANCIECHNPHHPDLEEM